MRALVLAVATAVLAMSCSGSPTAPSTVNTGAILTEQDAKPAHTPGTTKAILYFYTDDYEPGEPGFLPGLPVSLTGMPSGVSATATTGRRGSVSIDLPKTDTSVHFSVTTNPLGVCAVAGDITVPYEVKENWILVHQHCW